MGARKLNIIKSNDQSNLKLVEKTSDEVLVKEENPILKKAKDDFDRFNTLYARSQMDAVLLIKKWISQSSSNDVSALKAVGQQLESDFLTSIFNKLNSNEREIWKQKVDGFLSGVELLHANQFISEEVVRDSIAPQGVSDMELIDLLLSLEVETAVNFVKENKNEAKILLNLLQPRLGGKILDKLEIDESKELIGQSLMFDFHSVTDEFKLFKSVLSAFVEKSKKKPFNLKILQMLPSFNPNKEKMLYNVLAKENLKTDMMSAANANFPSELIGELPVDLLKALMQKYPADIRIQLLASVEGSMKNTLLSSFAEVGSAAREMIDLEFENLENDQGMKARINSQKSQLWFDFVKYIRNFLKDDEKYTTDIELIVSSWVDSMCSSESQAA